MKFISAIRHLLFRDRALLRWTACSGFSFATVLGITAGLHEIVGIDEKFSFLAPLVFVFFINFITLRYFVYGRSTRPIITQFIQYGVSAMIFRSLEYCAYWLALDLLGVNYLVAVLVIMPTSFLLKFLFYRVAVFGSLQGQTGTRVGAHGLRL